MLSEDELVKRHKHDLSQTRELIIFLIKRLDSVIAENKIEEEFMSEWKYIWGEKENAVSILTKLSGLLVKVIPMEQEPDKQRPEDKKSKNRVLTDDDRAIIRRYAERNQLLKHKD